MDGLSGIMISNTVVDIFLHDTYYIIAHFHFILSLGAIIGVKVGIELYTKNLIGYSLNPFLSRVEFWTFIIGVFLTFFPMHYLGFLGMPRRYPDYPLIYKSYHQLSTLGSLIWIS